MIVVDASVLIDAFLGQPRSLAVLNVPQPHAPVTIDAEVLNALRKMLLRGDVSIDDAHDVVRLLGDTPILRHSLEPFVPRMWQLRHNVSAYDAAYVALAESLNMPLLTRDRRLAQSAGHAARIDYID